MPCIQVGLAGFSFIFAFSSFLQGAYREFARHFSAFNPFCTCSAPQLRKHLPFFGHKLLGIRGGSFFLRTLTTAPIFFGDKLLRIRLFFAMVKERAKKHIYIWPLRRYCL